MLSSAKKINSRVVQSVHDVFRTHRRKRMPHITFTNVYFTIVDPYQDDPMVITVEIKKFVVKKILIDQGSSIDTLYWKTYKKLEFPEDAMTPYDELIYGFPRERVSTKGYIHLHTTFEEGNLTKTISI